MNKFNYFLYIYSIYKMDSLSMDANFNPDDYSTGGYMLGGYMLGGKGTAEGARKAREKKALKRMAIVPYVEPKKHKKSRAKKSNSPSLAELKKEAKRIGLRGYSKLNKKELEHALRSHESHHKKHHGGEVEARKEVEHAAKLLSEAAKVLERAHRKL
jgi:hypothetical protein